MKKIYLIPLVGIVVAVIEHGKACGIHQQNPTWKNFEKTWEAFRNFHIALFSFLAPIVIGILAVIVLHAPWPWK